MCCDHGAPGDHVANATELAAAVRVLKNFGRRASGADECVERISQSGTPLRTLHRCALSWLQRYIEARGLNLKFTDLQAVVGVEQMKKLPERVARMRAMWFRYRAGLEGAAGITMLDAPESDPGWIPWCAREHARNAHTRA